MRLQGSKSIFLAMLFLALAAGAGLLPGFRVLAADVTFEGVVESVSEETGVTEYVVKADTGDLSGWIAVLYTGNVNPCPGGKADLTPGITAGDRVAVYGYTIAERTVAVDCQPYYIYANVDVDVWTVYFEVQGITLPITIFVGDSVRFGVQVKNTGDGEGTEDITLDISDNTGAIVNSISKTITLGPGASTTVNFGYTFTSSGQYTLRAASKDSTYLVVIDVWEKEQPNKPPVARVNVSPTSGETPLRVSYSAEGSYDQDGSISSYYWTFGDGSSSSQFSGSHTYNSPGTYQVRLKVTDDDGATGSASLVVYVHERAKEPPVANANADPTSGNTPLSVNFSSSGSYDPDGSITSYYWTFGDGGTSSSSNPSHTYNNPGTYTATLTVTDNDDLTDTDSVTIKVEPPPNHPPTIVLDFPNGGEVLSGTVGIQYHGRDDDRDSLEVTIQLSDNGGSSWQTIKSSLHSTFPDFTESNLPWDTTTVPDGDNYRMRAIADDGNGGTDTDTSGIFEIRNRRNEPPQADFDWTPSSPKEGEEVSFNDRSDDPDGYIDSWHWDFGDGSTSTSQNPRHTYSSAGNYEVCLRVTDNEGASDTACKNISIGRQIQPPTADFSWEPSNPKAGEAVHFHDESRDPDGYIASWSWDFGDGGSSSSQNPTHTYSSSGSYQICLTATDNDGASDESCKTLTCSPKDADEDGIPDDQDNCVNVPNPDQNDTDGDQKGDACDTDDDDDGIPDSNDDCPLEPGPASNNGCPVEDRDGDGVPDDQDACPTIPGNDSRGCPEVQPLECLKSSGKAELTQLRSGVFPLILIHGIFAKCKGTWSDMVNSIEKESSLDKFALYKLDYPSEHWALKDAAEGLKVQLDRLQRDDKFPQDKPITIIAHSRGGLVARYYMSALDQGARVKLLISIDTPHLGTEAASGISCLLTGDPLSCSMTDTKTEIASKICSILDIKCKFGQDILSLLKEWLKASGTLSGILDMEPTSSEIISLNLLEQHGSKIITYAGSRCPIAEFSGEDNIPELIMNLFLTSSSEDDCVIPVFSQHMVGGENTEGGTFPVNHTAMLHNQEVINSVLKDLKDILADMIEKQQVPSITELGISERDSSVPLGHSVKTSAGQTIRLWYKINNPKYTIFGGTVLGASLRTPDGRIIDDPANDKQIDILPGERWYSRNFAIPSDASNGAYDAAFALWKDRTFTERLQGPIWKDDWVLIGKVQQGIYLSGGVNLTSTYRSQSWNEISNDCEIAPLAPSERQTAKSVLWWYDPSKKDYVEVSTTTDLDPTKGYFVSIKDKCKLQLDAAPSGESRGLKKGWNLFSVLQEATWKDVQGSCHSNIRKSGHEVVIGFDETHRFRKLLDNELLYPYKGYLVRLDGTCDPNLATLSGSSRIGAAHLQGNISSHFTSAASLHPTDVIPPLPEPEKFPAAPSNLQAASTDGKVNLTWQDNADNETGYAVERREEGGLFDFVVTDLPTDAESYTDTISGNQKYCYRVLAFNDFGASLPSEEACVTSTGGLSIEEAVAQHSGDPTLVEDPDILWAIEFWINGAEVPNTGGKTIGDSEMLELVQLWINGQPVSSASTSGQAAGQDHEALVVQRILAYPSPISNHGLAHFIVEGQGIQDINVQVFDLAGQKVFGSGLVAGRELSWNLLNDQGRALANGVYLYVVTVRGFDGETIRSKVRKLVVLR